MFFFKLSHPLNKPLRNHISRNRSSNSRKYIKIKQLKQAGFTLIELMIAVTLTSFIALAISSVFIFSIEQFHILMQQHKTEESMLFASYHIRSYLSQAVNMQLVDTVENQRCHLISSDVTEADRGFIVAYNYHSEDVSLSPDPDNRNRCEGYPPTPPSTTYPNPIPNFPQTALVALFPRENSFQNTSVDLFETSIFYEHPTDSTPGRLIFGLGTRTNGDTGFLHSPDSPNNIIYTGLSKFEIIIGDGDIKELTNICTSSGCGPHSPPILMVKKVQVNLTFRYFLFTEGSGGNFYDYTANIREVNAKELKNTIDINFHNNTMAKCADSVTGCDPTTHPTGKERIFGPIYFYKLVVPAGILNF